MKKLSFPEFTGFALSSAEMKRISGGKYGVSSMDGRLIQCFDEKEKAEELAAELEGGICSDCC